MNKEICDVKLVEKELIKNDYENKKSYDEIKQLNEELLQQLDDIAVDIKEFNIILEEEINERTRTEEVLKERERQFRYAIEEAPVPIILYTEDGKIKNINRAWADITGYTVEELPITSRWGQVSDIFMEDLNETNLMEMFSLDKRHNNGEYSVRTKGGSIRVWNFYTAHIGKLQNGQNLLMRVAIDITENKKMEELQKSVDEERQRLYEIKEYDRIKTEFFSNISHELRTPINVIFSAIQTYEFTQKDCSCKNASIDRQKYTKIMKQNCYRILRLINNLIDITKIDSGYLDINKVNINIISLIEDITISVVDYMKNKGLSLVFDTDVEEKIIACDPEKIERIFLNLLSNAVKCTPYGGNIMVNIEDHIENICIRVKDSGRGIPKDKLDCIFERFIQVDKSLTRDHEGSGIGLSLVKDLVELHGGTISVKSIDGEGAEFIIYIPCNLVDGVKEKIVDNTSIEKINIEFSDIYN